MGNFLPHYDDGPISMVASATITGGNVLEVTGNMTVGPAGAASTKVCGVAAYDAVSGASLTIYTEGVCDLVASGAISAGDKVVAAAAGKVATVGANTFATVIGVALEAIADTATGRVLLNLS